MRTKGYLRGISAFKIGMGGQALVWNSGVEKTYLIFDTELLVPAALQADGIFLVH